MTAEPDDLSREAPQRILVLPAVAVLAMAALPWLTEYLEQGSFPHNALDCLSEIMGSGVTLLLGGWVLMLLRREQRTVQRHVGELERLTLTDPLTGLGNRRALERDLERALERARRLNEPLSLLYLDLDDFKHLNDRFGHSVGDRALRALGAVLRSCSRIGTDSAYRVGGDEFVMTLVTDHAGAESLARRVTQRFSENAPEAAGVSVGVVAWDGRASSGELLDRADSRMYLRKRESRVVAPA